MVSVRENCCSLVLGNRFVVVQSSLWEIGVDWSLGYQIHRKSPETKSRVKRETNKMETFSRLFQCGFCLRAQINSRADYFDCFERLAVRLDFESALYHPSRLSAFVCHV